MKKHCGAWRPVIARVVEKYLDCGILKNGFARVRCPNCKNEFLLAFSCKRKGFCPSCSAKRSMLWSEFVRGKVLADCPHRHLVFSIPKMFRIFFLFHRNLLSQLSRCAWKTICQYLEVSISEEHQPAGILSIATAGDFLNWNPHIQALVASGVFRADGSFVTVPLFQENVLRELFEANVFKLLVSQGLITAELIAKMRTWKHSGFHVYAGPTITDIARLTLHIPDHGAQTIRYCGRYSNVSRGKAAKRRYRLIKLTGCIPVGKIPKVIASKNAKNPGPH